MSDSEVQTKLYVIDTLLDKVDYSKPRRLDMSNTTLQEKLEDLKKPKDPTTFEVHQVQMYRGPCIFNDFSVLELIRFICLFLSIIDEPYSSSSFNVSRETFEILIPGFFIKLESIKLYA